MDGKHCTVSITLVLAALRLCAEGASPSVRVHNFVVNPSTGPTTSITVKNTRTTPFAGTLAARFPAGWQVTPGNHELRLAAGETRQLPFTVEKAVETFATNGYPVAVTIEGPGATQAVTQNVVWASAPYFKPKIDGKTSEWKDAVPIRWCTAGKRTFVSLYWNRKQFCLLAQVEEKRLIGLGKSKENDGIDAIQFAVSPAGAATGGKDADRSARHEFLLTDSGKLWGKDRCFALLKPGMELGTARSAGKLEDLGFADAEVAVRRSGGTTVYEAAIPFKAMPELRPTAGREFCFSLLVHDPDGTGIRDLGVLFNLDDSRRPPLAWCAWEHARWGNYVPFDNKVEFGFCSSIH